MFNPLEREMKQSPRLEAAKKGEREFVGGPCRRCGGTRRYTAAGNCVACAKAATAKYNAGIRKILKEA